MRIVFSLFITKKCPLAVFIYLRSHVMACHRTLLWCQASFHVLHRGQDPRAGREDEKSGGVGARGLGGRSEMDGINEIRSFFWPSFVEKCPLLCKASSHHFGHLFLLPQKKFGSKPISTATLGCGGGPPYWALADVPDAQERLVSLEPVLVGFKVQLFGNLLKNNFFELSDWTVFTFLHLKPIVSKDCFVANMEKKTSDFCRSSDLFPRSQPLPKPENLIGATWRFKRWSNLDVLKLELGDSSVDRTWMFAIWKGGCFVDVLLLLMICYVDVV